MTVVFCFLSIDDVAGFLMELVRLIYMKVYPCVIPVSVLIVAVFIVGGNAFGVQDQVILILPAYHLTTALGQVGGVRHHVYTR